MFDNLSIASDRISSEWVYMLILASSVVHVLSLP